MSDAIDQLGANTPVHPAVFLASLTDYVNGILHGRWITVRPGVTDLTAEIGSILATSPWTVRTGEPAEEWVLLDHEGFPGPSPEPHASPLEIEQLAWPGIHPVSPSQASVGPDDRRNT